MFGQLRRRRTGSMRPNWRDRPQPPSALRVATGRAGIFVAPPPLWQSMGVVASRRDASRTRPVALATNVSVFTERCTRMARDETEDREHQCGAERVRRMPFAENSRWMGPPRASRHTSRRQ